MRLSYAAALSTALGTVSALRMPIKPTNHKRDPAHSTSVSINNTADPFNFGLVNTQGDGQIIYVATILVDGQPFEVQLDTGSSDLWLNTENTTFQHAIDTSIPATIAYGDGTIASGDVFVAEVHFGDFVVSQQAFINAPGSNATTTTDQGLLGVGPPMLSVVAQALETSQHNGVSLLDNIFNFYPNEPNFITFQLTRSDLGITDGGIFTVGEVASNFTTITNQPQLPVLAASNEWLTAMDGVIVNGQAYSGHGLLDGQTGIPAPFEGKLLSLIDSGTSLAAAPAFYVDLIYKNIPGAQPVDGAPGFFAVPCDSKVNVSMVFNGVEFPIHPLDMTRLVDDGSGNAVCLNTFTPLNDSLHDFILGDSFMRNAYSLFDYGNWTTSSDGNPFIQLLSLTDKDQAWAEFDTLNAARIQQFDQIMGTNAGNPSVVPSAAQQPTASANANSAPTSSPSDSSSPSTGKSLSGALEGSTSGSSVDISGLLRNTYIIMGLLGGIIALLLGVIISLMRGNKGYKEVHNPAFGRIPPSKDYAYETPYDS